MDRVNTEVFGTFLRFDIIIIIKIKVIKEIESIIVSMQVVKRESESRAFAVAHRHDLSLLINYLF